MNDFPTPRSPQKTCVSSAVFNHLLSLEAEKFFAALGPDSFHRYAQIERGFFILFQSVLFKFFLILSLLLVLSTPSLAQSTRVAVAANFTLPMKALLTAFEEDSGHSLSVSYGSSGKLYAQIQHGAPFDVFLSADTQKPKALIESGFAVSDTLMTYAVGRLTLWSGDSTEAQALLSNGEYKKLAIPNPRLAPYGAAAIEVLERLEMLDKSRMVTGENITQTYQFIATGNADIGFIAVSQLIKDGKLPEGAWLVPQEMHEPILQDAVLLKRGQENKAALALIEFLHSKRAHKIIEQYGYSVI